MTDPKVLVFVHFEGIVGLKGMEGFPGADGDVGPPGLLGPTGVIGFPGIPGEKGSKIVLNNPLDPGEDQHLISLYNIAG